MYVRNRGPAITATDYWQSEHAERGLIYISINAGAGRLLLPAPIKDDVLDHARLAHRVLLSRGMEVVKIVLDDGSDEPYTILIDAQQCDRVWDASARGRELPVTLWVQGGAGGESVELAHELPGRIE